MDAATLYEEDFHAWSEQQTAVLRRLPRGSIPNDLDLEHVAEEIEDLGNAERKAVCSLLRQLFVHLIKLHLMPSDQAARHWADEADTFRLQARDHYSPSMAQRIDLDETWRDAIHHLAGLMRRQDADRWTELEPGLDHFPRCPFGIDDLLLGRRYAEDLLRLMRDRVQGGP